MTAKVPRDFEVGDKGTHNLHPAEPWLIIGLYNGSVNIYYHQRGAIVYHDL